MLSALSVICTVKLTCLGDQHELTNDIDYILRENIPQSSVSFHNFSVASHLSVQAWADKKDTVSFQWFTMQF